MKESYSINIIGTITTDLELKTTQNGKDIVVNENDNATINKEDMVEDEYLDKE